LEERRYRHIKLVERTIGGSSVLADRVPFLKESLFKPIFHDLWAIRHQM
jgi:tryptophan 2,3-dioxygenase